MEKFFFFVANEYSIKAIRQRVNRVIYCNAFFSGMQLQIQLNITLISSLNYPYK